jgi:hypothetical protein
MYMNTIFAAAAFLLGAASTALAQSAYTTGTIASDERAGYSAPSGSLYDYAPSYVYNRVADRRHLAHFR